MRRPNWRFIITGLILIILAVGFYLFMLTVAPSSTDPAAMMQTVGSVLGTLIGISVVLIILGAIGKKF